MMVAISFVSCFQEDYEVDGHKANQALFSNVGKKGETPSGDTLVGYSYKDVKERFVGEAVEYSFTHINVYSKAGAVPSEERTSIVLPILHTGVEPQYFHYSDVDFTTSKGESMKADSAFVQGAWSVNYVALSQNWEAANASSDSVHHSTKTAAAEVTFTFDGDSVNKGYTVEFDAPSFTLAENTLDNENVIGLPYEGKTWEATKYESVITAKFEIAEDILMAGSDASKELKVSNLAFFLKHVVNTSIEDMTYVGKFEANGAELSTIEEKVSGKLVTRDNGEIVKSEAFARAMELMAKMTSADDVTVDSENALKDETFTHTLSKVASEDGKNDGVFAEKIFAGIDTITLADAVIYLPFGYNRWSWGEEVLPYAEITNREVSVKAEKNDELSTAAKSVWTVKVTSVITVAFVGIDREAETYELSVSYNRSYSLPDDWSHEFTQTGYQLSLKSESASRLASKENYNSVYHVVKNRGELYSSSNEKFELNLWAQLEGGDTVVVNEISDMTVLAVEDQPDETKWVAPADTNGFAVRYTKDSQIIRLKGGNVLKYKWYSERQYKNDSPIWDYAEVNGATEVTFSEPVLVDSVLKNNKIEKVYKRDAQIVPVVTTSKSAQKAATRGAASAATNNVNTLAISAPVYQKVIVNDEYVSNRIEKIVTVNGNTIDWTVNLYETWSISGENLKDSKSGTLQATLNGSDGGDIIVTNINFATAGTGLNQTGNGTYSNTADNGTEQFVNNFTYSAPASIEVVMNGSNGSVKDSIRTSFVLTDNGQNIGAKNAIAGYDTYPYTAQVKGIYTVEEKNVELSAEATKTLKVQRNVQDVTGKTIAWCNFSIVPAVKNGNTYTYVNGSHNPIKCMVIGFTDGSAEAVLFTEEPTVDGVQNAYMAAGPYTNVYNGAALYGGNWVPAIAQDEAWGISYSLTPGDCYFPVGSESLAQWGWNSTVLAGYTATVTDGILAVWHNGELVLEIK